MTESLFEGNRLTGASGGERGQGFLLRAGTAVVSNSRFDGMNLPNSGVGLIGTTGSGADDVDLTVRDVLVENNQGAGLVLTGNNSGTKNALIERTTVRNNTNLTGGNGAGLVAQLGYQVVVVNSTFSGNLGEWGSIVSRHEETEVTLTNVTIVAHPDSELTAFRGTVVADEGTVTLNNTVVLGQGSLACIVAEFGGSIFGSGNADDDNTCPGSITVDATSLLPLFVPVESLPVHPLPGNSPLRDAGSPGACPDEDQLGNVRPVGPACDIGAVEFFVTYGYRAVVPGAAKD